MLKVLILDDEECIRNSIKIHLSHLGHLVETAANPLECRCVQSGRCLEDGPHADVIIADQCMPHMTGLEFIAGRAGRGCQGHKQHLAIMSANLSDAEILHANELGCRVFIKPFSLDELEQWLQSIA